MSKNLRTALILALALACMYFLRLDSAETQPWDEGLYALRAQSIVTHNAWLDQTEYAMGGLYSSTPPPLVPWVVATSISLFGNGEASIRLFSVICSLMSFILVYLISLRCMTHRTSLLAMCILAGSWHWLVYSRQAMTEVPLMAFCLLAVWASLKLLETDSARSRLIYSCLGGLAFAGALHTKMVVSVIPLMVFVVVAMQSRVVLKYLALATIIGIGLALPWYGMMAFKYGQQFLSPLAIPQLGIAVEGNARSLGVLYYANQLLVAHPLFALVFIGAAISLWRFKKKALSSPTVTTIMWIWFVVGLIIFSIAPTKNPHYVVVIIPPAVVLSAYIIEQLTKAQRSSLIVLIVGMLVFVSAWSLLPQARGVYGVAGIVGGILLLIVVSRLFSHPVTSTIIMPVAYGVAALMLVRSAWIIGTDQPNLIRGGRDVAKILMESGGSHFGYMYHQHNEADIYNPQLSWYLQTSAHDWNKAGSQVPFAMHEKSADRRVLEQALSSGLPIIVYYHPGVEGGLMELVDSTLKSSYTVFTMPSEHYTLYKRVQFQPSL